MTGLIQDFDVESLRAVKSVRSVQTQTIAQFATPTASGTILIALGSNARFVRKTCLFSPSSRFSQMTSKLLP